MSSARPEERTEASDHQVTPDGADLPSLAGMAGAEDEADVTVRDVRLESAVATAAILAGGAFIYFGAQLRQGAIPDPVGTGGMPIGTGIFIIVMAGFVLARALRAWGQSHALVPSEGSNDEPGFAASWVRVIVFVVGSMLWTFLLPRISYVIATPVFLALGLHLFGIRSWMKLTLVPVIFTGVCWYLFGQVLAIQLPWGFLEPWAREVGLIL